MAHCVHTNRSADVIAAWQPNTSDKQVGTWSADLHVAALALKRPEGAPEGRQHRQGESDRVHLARAAADPALVPRLLRRVRSSRPAEGLREVAQRRESDDQIFLGASSVSLQK